MYFGIYSFADIQSTRDVLCHYSSNNVSVLESYDHLSKSWAEYKSLHQEQFDLEKLLKAVEFAAEKHFGQLRENSDTPYIIFPMGVCKHLWNAGSIRNVSILISAILQDTLESTNASEAEIDDLFGTRILYIVQEITDDLTLSNEDDDKFQIILNMSLDGQLIKVAESLNNVKNPYPLPEGLTEDKIERSYRWAEKLLFALKDTNPGLENALQMQLEEYKNKINGYHKVVGYERTWYFDYSKHSYLSGDEDPPKVISRHAAILDNGTTWWIDYGLYCSMQLSLFGGDEVEIKPLGDGIRYLMNIDNKSILFSTTDHKTFQ